MQPKHDYTALDAAILEAIKTNGQITFASLERLQPVGAIALGLEHASHEQPIKRKPAFRFVDSRLQALRKKGLIAACRGGWSMVEAAA